METRALDHRTDDDNRRRHCGIYALCDWLAGSDVQWLYGIAEDNAYYSHDHGFYLTGPEWTEASLAAGRDIPYGLSIPPDLLDGHDWRDSPTLSKDSHDKTSTPSYPSFPATGPSQTPSWTPWPRSLIIGVGRSLHACEG